MHETAVVEGLMRILNEYARKNAVERISRIRLKIGLLRGLDVRQIRGCFELFAEGTAAEGADLLIEEIAVTARCRGCGGTYRVERYHFECPACGSNDGEVLTGRELYIESFDAAPAEVAEG